MASSLSIALIIVSCLLLPYNVLAQFNQRVTLYTGINGAGQTTTIVENYQPDLAAQGFSDLAYSACVTGVWLFYDYVNYNKQTGGLMEWLYGPNNNCFNFNNLGGKVSSVRFAGSPKDYRSDTFTIFEKTYFQGDEEYIYQDQPSIGLIQHESALLTGNSAWTVYDRSNYQGNAICLYPQDGQNYTPEFISTLANAGIPANTIRSVRKGCYGKKISLQTTMTGGSGSPFNFTQSDYKSLTNKNFDV